jgi:hypothetical protein
MDTFSHGIATGCGDEQNLQPDNEQKGFGL